MEYIYDMDLHLSDGEIVNETVEVDYEYSYDINVSIFAKRRQETKVAAKENEKKPSRSGENRLKYSRRSLSQIWCQANWCIPLQTF